MLKLYLMAFTMQIATGTVYPYSQILLRNIGLSQSLVGILFAFGQLAACLFPLLLSNIADKTGKTKSMYIFALISMVISHAIFILIPKKTLVFLFFIIAYAFTGSITSLGDSMINLSINKTGGNYSNYRATGTLGYVIALTTFAIIGFPNSENNIQILQAMILTGLMLLFTTLLNPNPPVKKTNIKNNSIFDFKWFDKTFYVLCAIIFIKSIANSVVEKLLGSYMTEILHLGNNFTFFVALGGFSEFIFMLIAGKQLNKGKISGMTLIILSCIGIIVRLTLYVISESIIVFTIAQLLHCLTYASSHIAMIYYISKHIPQEHTGLATAIYSSIAMSASQLIGSLGGGFIIDYLGYNSLFKIYTVFPLIALIICIANRKKISF